MSSLHYQYGDSRKEANNFPNCFFALVLAADYVPQKTITNPDGSILTRKQHTRWIYIGGSGDLAIEPALNPGTTVVLKSLPNGWYPIEATKIYLAGTTATNIVVDIADGAIGQITVPVVVTSMLWPDSTNMLWPDLTQMNWNN